MMDTIFIENLIVSGRHGARSGEKNRAQRFRIDTVLSCGTTSSTASDVLADAIDYSHVKTIITDTVADISFNLLETLADHIAKNLLRETEAHSVTITIRKLDVWKNGTPGVTIHRKK